MERSPTAADPAASTPTPPNRPPGPAPSPETAERFLPVHVDSIQCQVLNLDLWIKHRQHARPALYRATGVELTGSDLARLREQGVEFLYITAAQHSAYRALVVRQVDQAMACPSASPAQRADAVRKTCCRMIEELMTGPPTPESVELIGVVSRSVVEWMGKDPESGSFLVDMAAHSYFTARHMVNVGMGCAMLARRLRPDDPDLHAQMAQGGLLHDIGKRGVPARVLEKEGKLTPEEWAMIREHPTLGYDELAGQPGVPGTVLEMTRDHHERPDGSGYPAGRRGDATGFPAKVCAVVDVFDAINSARPYRGPVHPRDVLDTMRKGVGTQFDPDIFKAWEDAVQEIIRTPERTAGTTPGARRVSLSQMACSPTGDNAAVNASASDAKAGRTPAQDPTTATAILTARGGAKWEISLRIHAVHNHLAEVESASPLQTGQSLLLTLNRPVGGALDCRARVEHAKASESGGWLATLLLTPAEQAKAA